MLVDSHCHLDHLDLSQHNGVLDHAITAAQQAGVGHMLCVCIILEDLHKILSLAEHYEFVSTSVGVHPNELDAREPSVDELVELASHPQVVAVGETGLDYYRIEDADIEFQQERFRKHIRAAKQLNKPLIIHTRQAREDTIRIMQEEGAAEVGGVMHCFTETWEMAQAAMEMNFYISFSGIVTFKNATELQDVAQRVPSDKFLIETDSPYLAPVPYRGKPNEPAYVRYVAEKMAELRGTTFAEIEAQSTANFFKCFPLANYMNSR